MLKMLRTVLAIIVIFISVYGLITNNSWLQPYMFLVLGLMILVMGLEEFRKGHKKSGYISIIVSLFLFFVTLQGFISK